MFNFSKSRLDSDLQNKTDVQYKVMVDWLRSTNRIVSSLERRQKIILLDIAKLYDLLLKDDSPPDYIEEQENDNSSTSRSVS